MAEIKLPIRIDGFKCVEDMVQTVLNYKYKGKTLKEWVDSISEPKTNADRIRMMSDEELAKWISGRKETCPPIKDYKCSAMSCYECWLAWMRKESEDGRT